jgi:hypothetical protein
MSPTMQAGLFVLCDAANVSIEGKLNLLGEFDTIRARDFPLHYPSLVLVVRLDGHPAEAGTHAVTMRLLDADGNDVVPPLGGAVTTGDQRYPGAGLRTAPLILRLDGVRFDAPGHYSFELLVDRAHLRSLPLHVLAAEPAPGVA